MGRTFTLYPAGGRAPRVLNDRSQGFRVLKGATGLNAPSFDLLTSNTPLLDGEQLDDVYADTREIYLPMLVTGRTESEFRSRTNELVADIFPFRGEGRLEVAQADGKRRSIPVIYQEGMEGSDAITDGGERWWKFGLKLRALSPWWEGVPVTQSWSYSDPVTFLPITPRKVASSQVLGDATLFNDGDVETYPSWAITSPADTVVAQRVDTGEQFAVDRPIPTGRKLSVVTAPRLTDVRLDDGTAYARYLRNGSALWRLPAGTSKLSLQVTGAAAGTVVTVAYTPRYATCL